MRLKILALGLILVKFVLGSSIVFSSTHPNMAESKDSFYKLKAALESRFKLISLPRGMSATSIASNNCKIKIMDSSLRDTIRLQVTSVDSRSVQFYVSLGQSFKLKSFSEHFEALTYTETCEVQGCDNNWYVDQYLVVDTDSLVISQIAPYTARETRVECELVQ